MDDGRQMMDDGRWTTICSLPFYHLVALSSCHPVTRSPCHPIILPPDHLATRSRTMNDPFSHAVAHFNAQEYREALLAFEELWHAERSDFLRALIQLSNALNQLRLGLVTAPRRSLASAAALLASCPPHYAGLDVSALRDAIARVRACIPDGLETGAGRVDWVDVPRIRLEA
jgi:hypothetical protein